MSQQNPLPPPEVSEGKLQGFDLTGRRVIVYGAEKPVAGAIVEALREAGAAVGVTSANTDGTSLFRLKKAAAGGATEAVDLSNGTNVQVATRKISKALGGVDAAIVVPQMYHTAPIRKTLDADIQRVLIANLGGTYAAFRSATREFRGRPGRLIAVLDATAVRGMTNLSLYSAAQVGSDRPGQIVEPGARANRDHSKRHRGRLDRFDAGSRTVLGGREPAPALHPNEEIRQTGRSGPVGGVPRLGGKRIHHRSGNPGRRRGVEAPVRVEPGQVRFLCLWRLQDKGYEITFVYITSETRDMR